MHEVDLNFFFLALATSPLHQSRPAPLACVLLCFISQARRFIFSDHGSSGWNCRIILSHLMDNFLRCVLQDNLVNTPSSRRAKTFHKLSVLQEGASVETAGTQKRMDGSLAPPIPSSLIS